MKRMTIEIKEKRLLSLKKNGLDGPCCCVASSPSFGSGVVGLYSDRRLTKSRHVSFQQSVGIRITGLKWHKLSHNNTFNISLSGDNIKSLHLDTPSEKSSFTLRLQFERKQI
jgi:hypothetical protein